MSFLGLNKICNQNLANYHKTASINQYMGLNLWNKHKTTFTFYMKHWFHTVCYISKGIFFLPYYEIFLKAFLWNWSDLFEFNFTPIIYISLWFCFLFFLDQCLLPLQFCVCRIVSDALSLSVSAHQRFCLDLFSLDQAWIVWKQILDFYSWDISFYKATHTSNSFGWILTNGPRLSIRTIK